MSDERSDLIASLDRQRFFLTNTLRSVSDDDARRRTTVSELTLGGLIKHVARTEQQWINFIVEGASAMGAVDDPELMASWLAAFRLGEDETVEAVLANYAEVAAATNELIRGLPDLDASQPLPAAPWFEPGARWSARRVVLHLVAEIAQHAGHADIVRESLDGAKSMG
jgi:hypothetical protein